MSEPRDSADPDRIFDKARRALEGLEGSSMAVLPEAARLLQGVAPELAPILASSGVRAQLDIHRRCSADARAQQELLFREATAANLCLLAAGVLSAWCWSAPASGAWSARTGSSAPRWPSASRPWRSAPWRRCSAIGRARATGCAAG